MTTTYDVRIWKTEVYKGKRANTYYVRWQVAGRRWKEPFKNAALAESFRSDLVSAARRGEAFDVESGRPVSMQRTTRTMSWYEFACAFVDMKWPRVAATTRRTHAEALTAVTTALFTTERGKPDDKLIRHTLSRWAFNTTRRNDKDMPQKVRAALKWIEGHTRPVWALAQPEILRPVLDGLTVRPDAQPAAPSVVSRRRRIFNTAMEYAVERKLLDTNPIPALKWTAPKPAVAVDRRRVVNPVQARTPPARSPRAGAGRAANGRLLRLHLLRRAAARGSGEPRQAASCPTGRGVGRVQPRPGRAARGPGVDRHRQQSRSASAQTTRSR